MIREVEEVILESLKKGLSELIPPENIIIGEVNPKEPKFISLLNTGFTIEDIGIGGSGGVKKEEVQADTKQDPNKNPWDTFRAMYKRMDELEKEMK